jgi:diguanylate cyclase (GGDEF)-like protein
MGVIVKTPDELGLANVRQHSDSISFLGFLFMGMGYYAERHRLQTSVWPFAVEFSSLVIASAIGLVASYGCGMVVFTSWLIIACYVILVSALGLLLAYQNRASLAAKGLHDWLTRLDALSRFFLDDTNHLTPEGVFAVLKQYLPGLAGLRLLDIPSTIGNTTPCEKTLVIEDRAIATLCFESMEAAEAIEPILPFLSNRLAQLVVQMRLSQEAVTDHLTEVYNRRALEILVPTLIARFSEAHHPLSVVITDLDFFKKVNDTYGHQVGDQVLIAFSQTLKRMLRAEDMIVRWGGEEFLLLLPGVTVFKAKDIIERIREAFAQQKIEPVEWPLTFSAGIAGGKVPNQSRFVQWITQADEALYQAKSKGRNQVEIFQDPANLDIQTSETTSINGLEAAQKQGHDDGKK